MLKVRIGALALMAAVVVACVPRAAPPAPAPAPAPIPERVSPPLRPAPTPPPANWMDAPLSAGDWRYRQEGGTTLAVFQSDVASLTLRCENGNALSMIVAGSQVPALYINTGYGDHRLATMRGTMNRSSVSLTATDPLLDQIAFSRGRFLVQADGGIRLILPTWPEIARVIEDCRGQ